MKKRSIFIVVLLLIAAVGFSSHKETVGLDEVGVRTLCGTTTVFQAGESAILLPVVHQFVKMTTKPVVFVMAGVGTISITAEDSTKISVDCKVRYQIDEPGKFIQVAGTVDPQKKVEDGIREKIHSVLSKHYQEGDLDLTKIETRLLVTAELLHELNKETLTPGIKILSFELLNW